MPVLAPDPAPAGGFGHAPEPANTDTGTLLDCVPVLAQAGPLPAAFPDVLAQVDFVDVPVLALKPGTATGWRIERFGPPGADGKGRYWQWRKGRGNERRSAYGGKV